MLHTIATVIAAAAIGTLLVTLAVALGDWQGGRSRE